MDGLLTMLPNNLGVQPRRTIKKWHDLERSHCCGVKLYCILLMLKQCTIYYWDDRGYNEME